MRRRLIRAKGDRSHLVIQCIRISLKCKMILLVLLTGCDGGTSDVLRGRKPLGLFERSRRNTQKGIVSAI